MSPVLLTTQCLCNLNSFTDHQCLCNVNSFTDHVVLAQRINRYTGGGDGGKGGGGGVRNCSYGIWRRRSNK